MPVLFCDNNPGKWGTIIEGVPVISFDELKKQYSDCEILITSLTYHDEILHQLNENNLRVKIGIGMEVLWNEEYHNYFNLVRNHRELFSQVYSLLSDEYSKKIFYHKINYCITANTKYLTPVQSKTGKYFDSEIITLSQNEVFIDGGAYMGDTAEEFLKQTGGVFKKVYSFEPEESKHKEFLKRIAAVKNIELLPYGLWSKKEIMRFDSGNASSSALNENGNLEVAVTSIDEVLGSAPATFIKMDIEGAEFEALLGAEKTIKNYRPKLAICVYHKPLDIVKIPLYIKNLVPEYKLYLRHYSDSSSETVLYAILE